MRSLAALPDGLNHQGEQQLQDRMMRRRIKRPSQPNVRFARIELWQEMFLFLLRCFADQDHQYFTEIYALNNLDDTHLNFNFQIIYKYHISCRIPYEHAAILFKD